MQSIQLFFNSDLFLKINTTCAILDLVLRFFLAETIQRISHSVIVTPSTTKLSHLFISVIESSIYSESNIANINSGISTLSIVKGSTLLTGTTSIGK